MSWLNFITLNSVAPIKDLHEISDAGAGKGLMQLHPVRDTELIACGKANTLLNGQYLPSPVLGNGSVTPAILVHGVFRMLQKRGFKIRLHCYQLGLDNHPDFRDSKLDDIVVHHCNLGEEAKLIEDILAPELRRQARNGEQHLIAESGIGGTTYATFWLRHWMGGELWFAGSSKDPEKLSKKKQLIEELISKTAHRPVAVNSFTDSTEYSDPVQRACCALLGSKLEEINFAGGAMIFAPVVAMQGQTKAVNLSIATTRWVLDSPHSQQVVNTLPDNCTLRIPDVKFDHSRFEAIRMYEKGFVTEGCGLGACLEFAERWGVERRELVTSLDKAVAPWVE